METIYELEEMLERVNQVYLRLTEVSYDEWELCENYSCYTIKTVGNKQRKRRPVSICNISKGPDRDINNASFLADSKKNIKLLIDTIEHMEPYVREALKDTKKKKSKWRRES